MELNMRNVSHYRPWRGITRDGEIVYGQILHAMVHEDLESEVWLLPEVSHTEEQPKIDSYVRIPGGRLQKFTKFFVDGVPIYEADSLVFECLNGEAVHRVFMTSYMNRVEGFAIMTTEGEKPLGQILEEESPRLLKLEDEVENGRLPRLVPEEESELVNVAEALANK